MSEVNATNGDFLKELQEIIRNNLKDPDFGVSSLAREVGMSRSNLHKKVNSLAKISVSQFIRQERLQAGLKLLKQTSSTVSEIAYEVGFNNVSYFIKCFHEYYGYSPGEVGKREQEVTEVQTSSKRKIKPVYLYVAVIILILVGSAFAFYNSKVKRNIPKTVAILPPYYETQDTSYLSIINGTVQNVIDNLNLIKDIERITPWLSVLQYKNSTKPAPEIATELKVNYVVKPSVLSYSGNIHLNFGLIEGLKDNQIWTNSYEIDVNDVTTIYQKISKEIAREINAQITPAEKDKIEKPITTNGTALNYYNAGIEFMNKYWGNRSIEYLEKASVQFSKSLEYDNECASAYAQLSIVTSVLYNNIHTLIYTGFNTYDKEQIDIYRKNISEYASLAMLYDPNLEKSLYARAQSLTVEGQYQTAIKYFVKALEYNPNFALAYYDLASLYRYMDVSSPKRVEYVLKGLYYATLENDSLKLDNFHSWAARSLREAGLYEEALTEIDKSIQLGPDNPELLGEKSEILILKNRNVDAAKEILTKLIREHPEYNVAKPYLFKDLFLNREFENAYALFNNLYKLNNNLIFGANKPNNWYLQRFVVTLEHLGYKNEYDIYKEILMSWQTDTTKIVKTYFDSYNLIRFYCVNHEPQKAILELRNFTGYSYFLAQHIYLLEFSPVFDIIRENQEYKEILNEIKTKFEANRDQIREMIKEKGLLDEQVNS